MKPFPFTMLVACGILMLLQSAQATAADAELDKLQGKWTVESFEYNGTAVAEMLGAVREFAGDKYTLTPKSGDTFNGTVKLDAAPTPKQIDLVLPDRTLKGIYEVDGATLKIAYTLEGDARPSEFASKPDSGVVLVVHKKAN
jgi:uncharacterized protein (TIGR03067 family)